MIKNDYQYLMAIKNNLRKIKRILKFFYTNNTIIRVIYYNKY